MDNIYYKKPNILNLTDISLTDYISFEEEAEKRLIIDDNDNNIFSYNKIPKVFTVLDKWPLETNLKCWSCCFTFNDRPIFIPIYIRDVNDSIEIGVYGNMCSFNCAELWIETHYCNREERQKMQNNLCYLFFIFTGRTITRIKPALCKTNLLQYGGNMDEDTFLDNMNTLKKNT